MEADVSSLRWSCSMLPHALQCLQQQVVGPTPGPLVPTRCSQLLNKALTRIQHLVVHMCTCQMVGLASLRMASTTPRQLLAAAEQMCHKTESDLDAFFNIVNCRAACFSSRMLKEVHLDAHCVAWSAI